MKRLLFNFRTIYIYTFVAGILVSLATNFFTTAFLSEKLTIDIYRVYAMALSLFMSSVGAFGVGAILDAARNKWELGGAPPGSMISGYISKYIKWAWFCFAIFLVGFLTSVFIYVWGDIIFNYFAPQTCQR